MTKNTGWLRNNQSTHGAKLLYVILIVEQTPAIVRAIKDEILILKFSNHNYKFKFSKHVCSK